MGRNLVKFKKFLTKSFLIRKYDIIYNRHFHVATTKEVESLHCFFVFGWIRLKFGNLRPLISNLNSKKAISVRNLEKMPLFFSSIMSFTLAPSHELVTMATMNDLSSIF